MLKVQLTPAKPSLRAIFPAWVKHLVRANLTSQHTGDCNLGVADAALE